MDTCSVCARLIEGPRLADPQIGSSVHPACLARRVPEDALVALVAAVAIVLAQTILVWAG
jgi:hypothetical protein